MNQPKQLVMTLELIKDYKLSDYIYDMVRIANGERIVVEVTYRKKLIQVKPGQTVEMVTQIYK